LDANSPESQIWTRFDFTKIILSTRTTEKNLDQVFRESFLRKSRWTRFYLAFGGGGRRCNPNVSAPLAEGLIVGTELAVLLANGTRERRQVKSDRAKFRLVREIRSGTSSELRIRHQCQRS
jgi:hypothetical protein